MEKLVKGTIVSFLKHKCLHCLKLENILNIYLYVLTGIQL